MATGVDNVPLSGAEETVTALDVGEIVSEADNVGFGWRVGVVLTGDAVDSVAFGWGVGVVLTGACLWPFLGACLGPLLIHHRLCMRGSSCPRTLVALSAGVSGAAVADAGCAICAS